jgi:hypothetical protein
MTNGGWRFHIYSKIKKKYEPWTGPFVTEEDALRWLEKYGAYWKKCGYKLVLIWNGIRVRHHKAA